jgi:hypothetical protein
MKQRFFRFLAKNILPFDYRGERYTLLAFLNNVMVKCFRIVILWDHNKRLYYFHHDWAVNFGRHTE